MKILARIDRRSGEAEPTHQLAEGTRLTTSAVGITAPALNRPLPGTKSITVSALFVTALLAGLQTSIPAQDNCVVWSNRFSQVPGTGVGTPGERAHHAMAYDSDRGVTVFFGGEIGKTGDEQYFNDTWEYDGTNQWRQIIVLDPKPAPRSFHSMAYDPVRKRVVLYGGWAAGGNYGFDDTWEYTGNGLFGTWTLVAGDPAGFGLVGRALVWDSIRAKVVAVGGEDAPFVSPTNPTYKSQNAMEWTGASWQPIVDAVNDPAYAHDIWGAGAAFDAARGLLVMVGGYDGPLYNNAQVEGRVWELLPNLAWQAGSPISPRVYPAVAYDERRQRVVVVGGDSGQTGTEDGVFEFVPDSGWVSLPSIPPNPVNGAPSGRAGAAMAYDSRRGVLVLMGGAGAGAEQAVPGDVIRGPGSRFSDTWELMPARVAILQDPTNTLASVCQATQFAVSATGNGTLRYQWRLDSQPLHDDDHYLGANTAQLTIHSLRYAQEGNYDVVIFDDCGTLSTVTSKVANLTLQPGLQWVLRATNGPTARTKSAMAYDSKRHVTVLFGGLGLDQDPNQLLPLNDLWEWNGSAWAQRMATSLTNGWVEQPHGSGSWHLTYQGNQPAYRDSHCIAYDSQRGRIVLFGGRASNPAGIDTLLNDTWEWDGAQWYFRTTNGPPSRFLAAMAYDSLRGVTVLYGGYDPNADYGVVWEWDGNSWSSKSPTNGPATNYSQDVGGMAYDSFRQLIFFGPSEEGFSAITFWKWDGLQWLSAGFAFSLYERTPYDGRIVFDSYRRRDVYFGGQTGGPVTNTTAFWDGNGWTLLPTNAPGPSPRYNQAMAYDSARHAVVMLGGQNDTFGNPQLVGNETWELLEADTPLINEQPASQFRNLGETAVFNVVAAGPAGATLAYTWHHGPAILIDGGRFSGAASSTLKIAKVTAADAGDYKVDVSSDCGTVTSGPAFLTLSAKLQLFPAGDSATLIWAVPSAVLQQADSVTGPWSPAQGAGSPFVVSIAGSAKFFRLGPPGPTSK
jgi:hypothetical protein